MFHIFIAEIKTDCNFLQRDQAGIKFVIF